MAEERPNDPATPAKKITPLQLREQYHLNIAHLAHQAKVGPSTVYYMMVGSPISRQQAEQILATISAFVEQRYTLENVQVALLPEDEGQAVPPDEGRTDDLA